MIISLVRVVNFGKQAPLQTAFANHVDMTGAPSHFANTNYTFFFIPKKHKRNDCVFFQKMPRAEAARPEPMAPTNMAAEVAREADDRRASPLSPCPEAQPPASRAPKSTKKPPTKLRSAPAPGSWITATPESQEEKKAPKMTPREEPNCAYESDE